MEKDPLWKSFGYAGSGIWAVIKKERNMKIHLAVTALVVVCGCIFHITRTEWLICLVLFALVMSLEMMNTAIEAVTDLASPKYSSLARLSKDAAAGAVLLSAVIAAGIGLSIFVPAFLRYVS